MDYWTVSGEILRGAKPWSADRVVVADARAIDYRGLQGKVDVMSGGPPCQPWSAAGLRLGHGDERDLLGEIHRMVAAAEPRAFVFENVPGLLSEANRPYLNAVVERLRQPAKGQRYGVTVGVLNAADYGAPQRRRRLFLIGLKDRPSSRAFEVFDRIATKATHHHPASPRPGRLPWEPVASILEDGLVRMVFRRPRCPVIQSRPG